MEDSIRIYWSGEGILRVAPYLDTYLGYKRIDSLIIFDPDTGKEILKTHTYDFGAPIKDEGGKYLIPISGVSCSLPAKLKKGSPKKDISEQINPKTPVAVFILQKDWYDNVSKSLDLYIPLIEGMAIREESRERVEYDYATHDDVTYVLLYFEIPLFWMKVSENERRSPRNRIYNELSELTEKWNSLLSVSYITTRNAVSYIDMADDIKAILAKLPEYEQEGDIKVEELSG